MSRLLEIQQLGVAFGARRAVTALDLRVDAGQTVALVGESGCGKSTTALAVMGLLPPGAAVEGRVLLEGVDLLSLDAARLRALRGGTVSMVFQEPMTSLNPVMTIGRQITEALRGQGSLTDRAARERAAELLDLVRIANPRARLDDFPHRLSGGQRQRVMIAMAVAREPRLLIADEPTTALDTNIQAQILELLQDLRSRLRMSLLLITHNLDVVGQYADRAAIMYAGKKVEEGTVADLFRSPGHAYTRGLLDTSLILDRDLHYRDGALARVHVLQDADTGELSFELARHQKSAAADAPASESAPHVAGAKGYGPHALVSADAAQPADSPPLLRVRDLRTHYTRDGQIVRAVDGVSFEIARGETLGLVGESGCGKSSLSRTLLRLIPAAGGTIELEGEDIGRLAGKALRAMRRKAQMVFQDPLASLNPRHTVQAALDTALRVHDVLDPEERRARILEALHRVDLPIDSLRRYPHEFSGGQRQRIAIARVLVLRPALVICDEPVSALDASVRAQVLNLLVELKRDLHLSYLFISHDLAVVRYVADRVLVMRGGRIVEEGDHRAIWERPEHEYTRALIRAVPRPPFAGGLGRAAETRLARPLARSRARSLA